MRSKVKMQFVLPLIIFTGIGFFLWSGLQQDPTQLPSMQTGKTLPKFSVPALDNPDTLITQDDIKGPALLNLWATWCPSCRIEHPVLNELARSGIRIYGIDHVDEREAAIAYLKLHGNPYTQVLFDKSGELGVDLGITGAPETFLVDAKGVVRFHHVGVVDEKAWREILWPQWLAMGGNRPTSNHE